MICSNCHKTTTNEFATKFKGIYYPICKHCAASIPTEQTEFGIQLYQIINNKTVPYKLLTIHNIIKYWTSFADVVMKLPSIFECFMQFGFGVTINELKTIGKELQDFSLQFPVNNYNYAEHWKEWEKRGYAKPYAYKGIIFTIYLTHNEKDWSLSISSPYLKPLSDELCKEIADCILPQENVEYCMGKVNPESPTTQFWKKGT
jgi:hypothetical protein